MGDFLLSVSFIDSIDRGLPVAVVALSKLKAAFNFDSFRARRSGMKKSKKPPYKAHSTLSALPHGRWATVLNVLGPGFISLRLMEMGLVPGASISVVRTAPLGDPLQIKLRDYHLALRRTEAEMIKVTLDGD